MRNWHCLNFNYSKCEEGEHCSVYVQYRGVQMVLAGGTFPWNGVLWICLAHCTWNFCTRKWRFMVQAVRGIRYVNGRLGHLVQWTWWKARRVPIAYRLRFSLNWMVLRHCTKTIYTISENGQWKESIDQKIKHTKWTNKFEQSGFYFEI